MFEIIDSRAEGRPIHYRSSRDATQVAQKMIRHGAAFVEIYYIGKRERVLVRKFVQGGPKNGTILADVNALKRLP